MEQLQSINRILNENKYTPTQYLGRGYEVSEEELSKYRFDVFNNNMEE